MSTAIAVLGTGSAGLHHLNALRGAGTLRPLAVPLRSERRSELEAAGFETARDLAHAAELGARACVIATETRRHSGDVREAIGCGLDVLVEKPFAPDAAQARALAGEAERAGRRIFVACVLRFSSSLARFRELLPRIGSPHAATIECRSHLPDWRPSRPYRDSYSARAADGGVLRDLIHEIDYAGWIFGWPQAVYAALGNTGRLGIEAEEWAEILWERPGAAVTVGLDYLTRAPRRGIRADGALGSLHWDAIAQRVTLAAAGSAPEVSDVPQTLEQTYREQILAFAAAAGAAGDPRLATARDGVAALAVCDAARASAQSRRREPVEAA